MDLVRVQFGHSSVNLVSILMHDNTLRVPTPSKTESRAAEPFLERRTVKAMQVAAVCQACDLYFGLSGCFVRRP